MDDQDVGINWETCYLTYLDKGEHFWIKQLGNDCLFWAVYLLSFWWGVLTTSLSNFIHRYFLKYWADWTCHHFKIL